MCVCVSVVTLPGPGTSLPIASRYMLWFRGGDAVGGQCLCVPVVTSCCVCLCVCGDFIGDRDKFAHCLKVHALLVCVCVCVCLCLCVCVCVSVVTSPGPGTSLPTASRYMLCWDVWVGGYMRECMYVCRWMGVWVYAHMCVCVCVCVCV